MPQKSGGEVVKMAMVEYYISLSYMIPIQNYHAQHLAAKYFFDGHRGQPDLSY